jgi:hypothetical protein
MHPRSFWACSPIRCPSIPSTVFAHVGGLGETGEVALIGEDGLLRNDSTRTENLNDILQTRIDEPFVAEAFANPVQQGVASLYRERKCTLMPSASTSWNALCHDVP